MMRKYKPFVFFFIAFLLQSGCKANVTLKEEAPVQKRTSEENGISIKTEEPLYHTLSEKITVLIKNDSKEEFTTGVYVFLEKKVEDTWYKVPMKNNSFEDIGMIHPPGKTSSLILNVHDLRDKLTSGEYRAIVGGLAAPFKVEHIEKD